MPAGTEGFLKLHRKIKDSAIYHAPAKCRLLFFEILLHATWEEDDYTFIGPKKVDVDKGEWITTYGDLAEKIEASKSTCKRYLETMKDADMIRTQSETHGKYRKTRITVVNWSKYQDSENDNLSVERQVAAGNERDLTSQSEHRTERGTERQCTKEVKKERSKESNTHGISDSARSLFEVWQDVEGTITHRSNKTEHRRAIKRRLDDGFTQSEIETAIERLSELYEGEHDTWLSTNWSCKEFFTRKSGGHLEKMIEQFDHFLKGDDSSGKPTRGPESNLQRVK